MELLFNTRNLHWWLWVLYVVINNTTSQYLTYHHKPGKTNNCENASSNTALVEHFFNLIFSEFLNHPPVCVCVQMCPDHATYCYPNGCLKKAPEKKTDHRLFQVVPHVHSIKDKSQMTFLVDPQKDFLETFLETKSVSDKVEKNNVLQNRINKADQATIRDLRPDPFKDRYKTIFKYRKSPKVHLRYNLREQVKNMKSDIIKIEKIDVSKTKWPVYDTKQFFLEAPVSEKAVHSYPSLGISVDHPQYPNKFFKRETVKNNVEVFGESDTVPDKSFSLENLIENLIESSFGPIQNDTELDLNVKVDYYNATPTKNEQITIPPKRHQLPKIIIINETMNVVSINNTNENIDNNKYTEIEKEENTYKNVYNELITKLSKNIEKQNNHSMELMEQILGHRFTDSSTSIETTEDKTTTTATQTITTITTSDITDEIQSAKMTEKNLTTTKEIESKAMDNIYISNYGNNTTNNRDNNDNNNNKNNSNINMNNNNNNKDHIANNDNTNNTNINNYSYINNNNSNFLRKSRQRFVKKFINSKKQIGVL